MKIFIPSKGRSETIRTPKLLTGADYKVILHTREEEAEYISRSPYLEGKTITSGPLVLLVSAIGSLIIL